MSSKARRLSKNRTGFERPFESLDCVRLYRLYNPHRLLRRPCQRSKLPDDRGHCESRQTRGLRGKEEPRATGEDGRLVQEVLYAAYQSAGKGRKIDLPFRPQAVKRPIDLWFNSVANQYLNYDYRTRWTL